MKTNVILFSIIYSFLAIFVLLNSCKKDDDDVTDDQNDPYAQGVFIICEGGFGSGNGSVDFYKSGSIENGIFENTNNRPLGDVVQSMAIHNEKGYIVVNNSHKIEVVTPDDFKSIAVIDELSLPRYFLGIDNEKAYVSQWGSGGSVKIINLATNTVTDSIIAGSGPENMVLINDFVYVANGGIYSNGVYINDSTISVIDINSNTIVKTIVVGDNPVDLVIDANNDLWVLCPGRPSWNQAGESASKLVRINTADNTVISTFVIGETDHPVNLAINGNKQIIYYGGGYSFAGIYAMNITDADIPQNALLSEIYYGFDIDSVTGNIFGCIAPDFTSNGELHIYQSDGTETGNYTVGIGPKGAVFKF